MKTKKDYFFIAILLFSITSIIAQKTSPGYYINNNQDTIKTEIRMNQGLFSGATKDYFISVIEVKDEQGEFKRFIPEDIKAYSVTNQGITYKMYSKPTKKGKNKFLAPVITGPNTNLYKYSIFTTGGAINNSQVFYTFERADGAFMFLNNVMKKSLKSELKDFYKDYPLAQAEIESRFKYWLDFEKDLKAVLVLVNDSPKI